MMKNILLFALLAFWFTSYAQEEKVVDLSINPQLYYKYKANQPAKKQLPVNYFLSPRTISLPFIDDFSVYHLKSYEPVENFPVVDTVNRTLTLTGDTLIFRYSGDTAWSYSYDTATNITDSTALPSIRFVLHDDSSDISIPTDTLTVWPLYYHEYEFDTVTGAALDSTLAPYDSLFYSPYYGVRDTNALWLDNYVFVNDNYPTNKLSIGVATFDGLDEFGVPHKNNTINNYGPADTLTSMPINLETYGLGDSVYLSFAFQPKGLGDKPEVIDSLILEFKLLGNDWTQIAAWAGSDSIISDPQFTYVMFLLDNPFYFVSDFQFRFRNKSTITGNNDHWHLDYVCLNESRTRVNAGINDVAISHRPDNFLANYTSMPWRQYVDNVDIERKDTIYLTLKNNYNLISGRIGDKAYEAYEAITNTPLLSFSTGVAQDIPPNESFTEIINISTLVHTAPAETDSVRINSVFTYAETEPSVTTATDNNTATTSTLFSNYYAYDDGTAERAYGVEGPGLKKFAYEFNLNKPDTLRALQFHFSQINDEMDSLFELTLLVWKEIVGTEDTLYMQERTPIYYIDDERNGFTTYRLDSPIVLQPGKFYVGWQQLFPENIQLGLDLNNIATKHMNYYTNGTWKKSGIQGAPMIRPIVGKNVPIIGTGIKEVLAKEQAVIYPNPAEDILYLRTPQPSQRVDIFDMQGKLIKTLNGAVQEIEIRDLEQGMYILRVLSGKNQPQSLRFVKM